MKQIVVLSGKGGTGKTTVTAALAHLASANGSVVLVDADVDASNLELVLSPIVVESNAFSGGRKAVIAPAACTACGLCQKLCRFEAIVFTGDVYRVEAVACEGCASCYYQCPAQAISMDEVVSGSWFRSDTRFGPLFHARLNPGEANSGKLVAMIRQQAIQLAQERATDWVIIDGSPGIGCPVIAAVTGVDLALLVTEPTVSGIADLGRILQTTQHFHVPSAVCLNKADLNRRQAEEILRYCREKGLPIVAQIPYDEVVIQAMVHGVPVTEFADGPVVGQIRLLWEKVQEIVKSSAAFA